MPKTRRRQARSTNKARGKGRGFPQVLDRTPKKLQDRSKYGRAK